MAEPSFQHVPPNADSLVMEALAVAFGPVADRNPDDSQLDKLLENGEQNALCKHAKTLKELCLSEDTLTEKDLHYRSLNCRPQCQKP